MQNNIQPCVMPNLAFVKNGQAVTTTYAISQWANKVHQGVFRIVTHNIDALKEFGAVSFENYQVKLKSGTKTFKIATLNYDQACLVICSMRNNEKTKQFKVELIKAFRKCREQLAKQNQRLTDKETENISMTEFSRGANIIRDKYANKIVTTRELVSEHNNFAFGISKNSLMYEYLKVMRKIKANKEQWQQEVEEFNAVVADACELSENCEKIKV
uniref:Rha family transcriptional regulator n=1 Tax=Succinivibrio sp. TaxID=2053619 RepID=UPI00402A8420